MADELAPEWEHQYVLSWSGKWHIIDVRTPREPGRLQRRSLCGALGYVEAHVPRSSGRLQDIKHARTQAPYCRKCERQNINKRG